MTEEERTLLNQRIDPLASGTCFILRKRFGDQWLNVAGPTGSYRRAFGKRFSDAVKRGEFPGVVSEDILIAGRDIVWRKL
jgi:hypothetical protein